MFLERHAPEASRYHAIIWELAWRRQADAHALEIEQPGYLIKSLGPVPITSHGRRAWRSAAIQIEAYRDWYGVADHDDALGPQPQGDLLRRKAWSECREAIDHQCRDERQGRALPRADHEAQRRELA